MLKTALIAAALAAIATAAPAQDYRSQAPYGFNSRGGYGDGYSGANSGFGRNCPLGYSPQTFPNGNGVRCEPPDNTTEFTPAR